MKRLIYILSLLLCLCLLFSGCNIAEAEKESDKPNESITQNQEQNENESTESPDSAPTSEPVTDVAIPDVVFFEPSKYVKRNFAIKDERAGITLSLPYEWDMKAVSGREYTITRDGTCVGKITTQKVDATGFEAFAYEAQNVSGIDVTRTLEHKDGTFRYRYTYAYTYNGEERLFTLTCNYDEISDFTMNKLFVPEKDDFTTDGGFSILEPYESVLIIGNSFVSTSEIGDMLRNMLDAGNKRCAVKDISIGHALVSTYTSNTEMMKDIWYGKYDAVFMCGLYNADQVKEVETLKRYCQTSDTQLIVFPAHNEARLVIQRVMMTYDDLVLLDWKGELDALIDAGVDRWDLCFDDTYDHSKPLAGYVGAHMIYRAMYGEIPPALIGSVHGYPQGVVDAFLGEYPSTGTVRLTERSDVYIFIS